MSTHEHSNRLVDETSPYLLQHADNPVDWHAWGPEALDRARRESRPILLSIGYAACHWCHVMERESFQHEPTAHLMNELFVCIKVDREERPDLDDVYMRAVQMMTGQGGWPLTVFLTPDLEPFHGGTYFPPEDRHGMPAFGRVLAGVHAAYVERPDEVRDLARQLRQQLQPRSPEQGDSAVPGVDLIRRAALELHGQYDANHGGFGAAPKFPHSTSISLLLRYAWRHHDADLLEAAVFSLEQMAGGGIYDQVGGGFHRYSTDARWLVPHFEKMLYDNALLATTYLEASQLTNHAGFADIARDTLDWVVREMQSPEGGYYSTLDADSEGVEGKYYVWSHGEIHALLGDDADAFCCAYDISAGGNWEGRNIPNCPRPSDLVAHDLGIDEPQLQGLLARGRHRLRTARAQRIAPALDDKLLVDWNGMMIAAMARGYRVLREPRYLDSALRAAEFIAGAMMPSGRLLHTYRDGQAKLLAYLDGYAHMLEAAIEIFECTFDGRWLRTAKQIADGMLELFWDTEHGGFFFTGSDHEALIARSKSGHDGATPSGNATAATWLQRLAALTGREHYSERAQDVLRHFAPQLLRMPSTFAQLLLAAQALDGEQREIVVVGAAGSEATHQALQRLWERYAPSDLVVLLDPQAPDAADLVEQVPLLAGKADAAIGNKPVFFSCRGHACDAPTTDLDAVLAQ